MKRILILAGRYLPGYKDGGPVRTLINLTDLLGDEYDFRLVVLDRDHGDTKPYPHIKIHEWNQVGKAKVWYYHPREMKFTLIRQLAKDAELMYLCGFYDGYGYKTLILKRLGLLYGKPVVVASMGTFSEGALSQKSMKKKFFIGLCKKLGLFKHVTWSVTSSYEKRDVKQCISQTAKCIIAEDPPRSVVSAENKERNGTLKVIFLSRICPQKNLLYCVKILQKVSCDVIFDIYGPIEDSAYWKSCHSALEALPARIRYRYCGEVETNNVPDVFAKYDIFLFPTLGENYGHVIFEALAAGCIPVISDQTPWKDLEENEVGYVISLDDEGRFVSVIEKCAQMHVEEMNKMFKNAVCYASRKVQRTKQESGYRILFERV